MHFITKILISLNLLLFVYCAAHAQKKPSVYLELRGNVDALGNIYLSSPVKTGKADTILNYAKLKPIVDLREPVKVLNKLAEQGWKLVSVTYINGTQDKDRPNTPFLLYYLCKENEAAN